MEYPLSKLLELLSNRDVDNESGSKYEATLQDILAFEAHSADWQSKQLLDAGWQRGTNLRQQTEGGVAGERQIRRLTPRMPLVAEVTYTPERTLELSLALRSSQDDSAYQIQGEVFISPPEQQSELTNSMILLYSNRQLIDATQPNADGAFLLQALSPGQLHLELQLQSGIAVRIEPFDLVVEPDSGI